jgi:hypothetical protein
MRVGASKANKTQNIVTIAGASLLLTIMSIIWHRTQLGLGGLALVLATTATVVSRRGISVKLRVMARAGCATEGPARR